MIKARIAGLLIAASVIAVAPAARASGQKLMWLGELSCGEWTAGGRPYNQFPKAGTLNWVLGYLSHSAIVMKTDLLDQVDQASVAAWMDNYCQANPLNSVYDGAAVLEKELFARVWTPPPVQPAPTPIKPRR